MPDNIIAQLSQRRQYRKEETEKVSNTLSKERQDNTAPVRASVASSQPYTLYTHQLPRGLDKKKERVKKHSTSRQSVSITLWVDEPIRIEVDKFAQDLGLSRSAMAKQLIEQAVHQKLHITHAQSMGSIVEKAVSKANQRIIPFLTQISYDSNQSQILIGHTLGQILKDDVELKRIRDRTASLARKNIFHIRPQIKEITETVIRWLASLKEGEVTE